MVDFFDKWYESIINKNRVLNKYRIYSALRFAIRFLANCTLWFNFKLTLNNPKHVLKERKDFNTRIIVSLTSFPLRIHKTWMAIETILRQETKPDIIILWLSKSQFPALETVPLNLRRQMSRGLRIELMEDDLKSHKKYSYVLKRYPDDITILIDDDIFYPSNVISNLIRWHTAFPDSIIARYGLRIITNGSHIESYKKWEDYYEQKSPDYNIFFGSGGGTLIPPHAFCNKILEDMNFMNTCLYADDIWLNSISRINNRTIFRTQNKGSSILPVLSRNNVTLASKNVQENENDIQLLAVRKYFQKEYNIDPFAHLSFDSSETSI